MACRAERNGVRRWGSRLSEIDHVIDRKFYFVLLAISLLVVSMFSPLLTSYFGRAKGLSGLPLIMVAVTIAWSIKISFSNQVEQLYRPALLGALAFGLAAYETYKTQKAYEIVSVLRKAGDKVLDPSMGQLQWGWIPFVLGIASLVFTAAFAASDH